MTNTNIQADKLEAEIQEILELDKKRTQGDWQGRPNSPYVHGQDGPKHLVMVHDGCAGDAEFYRNHPSQGFRDRLIADAQFIAASPRMVEIIKSLQSENQSLKAENHRYREALEKAKHEAMGAMLCFGKPDYYRGIKHCEAILDITPLPTSENKQEQ